MKLQSPQIGIKFAEQVNLDVFRGLKPLLVALPDACPFQTHFKLPPLCKLNPLFTALMILKVRYLFE